MMKTARPLENEQSNIATFSVSDAALSESRSRCGKIIRNYRIKAGLDVGQLGNMVGYTKSAITNCGGRHTSARGGSDWEALSHP